MRGAGRRALVAGRLLTSSLDLSAVPIRSRVSSRRDDQPNSGISPHPIILRNGRAFLPVQTSLPPFQAPINLLASTQDFSAHMWFALGVLDVGGLSVTKLSMTWLDSSEPLTSGTPFFPGGSHICVTGPVNTFKM